MKPQRVSHSEAEETLCGNASTALSSDFYAIGYGSCCIVLVMRFCKPGRKTESFLPDYFIRVSVVCCQLVHPNHPKKQQYAASNKE
jgi:hypothetical protein